MTFQIWFKNTLRSIHERLIKKGFYAALGTIASTLKDLGYSLKVNTKKKVWKNHPDRNIQFEYIENIRNYFLDAKKPVISIDTKKKETIGLFKNDGRSWQKKSIEVYDHDFPAYGKGKLIPFGIYDISLNQGMIYAGTSKETSKFVVDSIVEWWMDIGTFFYPEANELLILCDGGGANGSRRYAWKWEIQKQLSNKLGLIITVCHYPPYASKWNPIEHRLFSQISNSWSGIPLESYDIALKFIKDTTTKNGLRIGVKLVNEDYRKDEKIQKSQIETLLLFPHKICPRWNYTIHPQG